MPLIEKFSYAAHITWVASRGTGAKRTSNQLDRAYELALGSGTGVNQINEVWSDDRAIAAGLNDDLDLVGGITSDLTGVALTLTAIKFLWIVNNGLFTTSTLTIEATGGTWLANPWQMSLEQGGQMIWISPRAGDAVVTSTGDVLRVTNADGANAAAYFIALGGTV
jgi:hypothetical protein